MSEQQILAQLSVDNIRKHVRHIVDSMPSRLVSELSYSPGRHEKQRIAALMGSTAQIMRNWGHAENASLPLGSVKPACGNPTPETFKTEMPVIASIGISRIDGGYLIDQLANGPVHVRLNTQVENGWRELKMTIASSEQLRLRILSSRILRISTKL
jgi:hypothetical protein